MRSAGFEGAQLGFPEEQDLRPSSATQHREEREAGTARLHLQV